VLVNRGWVPVRKRLPATRADGQTAGLVRITGIVRLGHAPGPFAPPAAPAQHIFYAPDGDALARGLDGPVLSIIVEADADATPPGGWPRAGVTRLAIPNDHLQYALTWYGLAAVLAVIVALAWRRARAVARGQGHR
ncbi:MAG: SURF1 family protein, partial [Alphaproteobacteria bacterium]